MDKAEERRMEYDARVRTAKDQYSTNFDLLSFVDEVRRRLDRIETMLKRARKGAASD